MFPFFPEFCWLWFQEARSGVSFCAFASRTQDYVVQLYLSSLLSALLNLLLTNLLDPELDLSGLTANKVTYDNFKNLLTSEFEKTQAQLEPKRKAPSSKEYQEMAQALVGTWTGVSNGVGGPDVLAVSSLPHNTVQIIKDFLLCTHANLQETLVFKEPISWKNDEGKSVLYLCL